MKCLFKHHWVQLCTVIGYPVAKRCTRCGERRPL